MEKRTARFAGLAVLGLMLPPAVYFSVRYVKEPVLYAGDRMEVRACRDCSGSGKLEGMDEDIPVLGDRCPACGGKGRVNVIIPGPNRLTRVWGAVVDLENAGEDIAYHTPDNIKLTPMHTSLMPEEQKDIPGILRNVQVRFEPTGAESGGETFEIVSNSSGRFSQRLPPGNYAVKITLRGFEEFEEDFEVPPLTEPIWLEEANIMRQPDSYADAQGTYGLILLIGLARDGDEGAFLRVTPAWR